MSLRPLARAASTNAAWSVASLPPPGAWGHAAAARMHVAAAGLDRRVQLQARAVADAARCRGNVEEEVSCSLTEEPRRREEATHRGSQEKEVGARKGGWPVARPLEAVRQHRDNEGQLPPGRARCAGWRWHGRVHMGATWTLHGHCTCGSRMTRAPAATSRLGLRGRPRRATAAHSRPRGSMAARRRPASPPRYRQAVRHEGRPYPNPNPNPNPKPNPKPEHLKAAFHVMEDSRPNCARSAGSERPDHGKWLKARRTGLSDVCEVKSFAWAGMRGRVGAKGATSLRVREGIHT